MKRTLPTRDQKVMIPVNIQTFELILYYLISVRSMNRKFINNIQNLLKTMDLRGYMNDEYSMFLIKAIDFVANVRDDGINNLAYIRNAVEQSDLPQNYVNQLYDNIEMATADMTKDEYNNLNALVADYTDFSYLYKARPMIIKLFDEMMRGDRLSTQVIRELKDQLEILLQKIRVTDSSRDTNMSICINGKNNKQMKSFVRKIYDDANDPSNTFKTGLKELNRLLDGGFRRRKTYLFPAPTNSFKSGILLYICLWIMMFNPDIKPRFPGRKLAIILITMENTVEETGERIHSIFTNGQVDPRFEAFDNYNADWTQILEALDSNFALYIEYMDPITTTAAKIQAKVEEIEEDNNFEAAVVVVDHLGNVQKMDPNVPDWRGLVDSIYMLSGWAKTSERLLVTAMHTNSQFDTELAEARASGHENLVRRMGRHCIADAKYIDRAVDETIYMLKEFSNIDGQWYLGFKVEKSRMKRSSQNLTFYHKLENEIVLRWDEGTNYCWSSPCIPGTENAIQIAQQQANGIEAPTMPPTQPFGNHTRTGGNFGGAFNGFNKTMMNPPLNLQINQPVDLGLQPMTQQQDYSQFKEDDSNTDDFDFMDDISDDEFNQEIEEVINNDSPQQQTT